ncbi:putative oxidoreductase ZK1290.5 [Trichonephila clavipes]|nr:putative oxidoreductase ZK1290.5 [Trichonephila clavipes]
MLRMAAKSLSSSWRPAGTLNFFQSFREMRIFRISQVFDFQLTDDEMDILDNLHDGRRIVDISNIQEKIDSRLPDGYKLKLTSYESDKIPYRHCY